MNTNLLLYYLQQIADWITFYSDCMEESCHKKILNFKLSNGKNTHNTNIYPTHPLSIKANNICPLYFGLSVTCNPILLYKNIMN